MGLTSVLMEANSSALELPSVERPIGNSGASYFSITPGPKYGSRMHVHRCNPRNSHSGLTNNTKGCRLIGLAAASKGGRHKGKNDTRGRRKATPAQCGGAATGSTGC